MDSFNNLEHSALFSSRFQRIETKYSQQQSEVTRCNIPKLRLLINTTDLLHIVLSIFYTHAINDTHGIDDKHERWYTWWYMCDKWYTCDIRYDIPMIDKLKLYNRQWNLQELFAIRHLSIHGNILERCNFISTDDIKLFPFEWPSNWVLNCQFSQKYGCL
jgi:hypothetical protein